MPLQHEIEQQLDALAAGGELAVVRPEGTLRADVLAADRIGVSVMSVGLFTNRLDAATVDQLTQLGNLLAGRLSYLLEPISPIEIDSAGMTLQLRSVPPRKDESGTSYYELTARRGSLTLRRYNKTPGALRQPIAASLTREVVVRLANDFIAAVDEVQQA